jgi:hypothetical protein
MGMLSLTVPFHAAHNGWMSEIVQPTRHLRFSLRTVLAAMIFLGLILVEAKEYYRRTIKPGEMLEIRVNGTPVDVPIDGFFRVEDDGRVLLGPAYGRVIVADLSADSATVAIECHLRTILREPKVAVARIGADLAFKQLQAENRRLKALVETSRPVKVNPHELGQFKDNVFIDLGSRY